MNKQSSNQDRYSTNYWRPDLAWEILCRNDSYRKAIDTFLGGSSNSISMSKKPRPTLELFKSLSRITADEKVYGKSKAVVMKKKGVLPVTKVPKKKLPPQTNPQDAWLLDKAREHGLDFDTTNELYESDTRLSQFMASYGDVVAFPVHYHGLKNTSYLELLWQFTPAKHMSEKSADNTITLNLDLRFTDNAILESATQIIKRQLQHTRKTPPLKLFEANWNNMDGNLKVYKFWYDTRIKTGMEPTSKLMIEKFCPENISKKQQWLGGQLAAVESVATIFDRN